MTEGAIDYGTRARIGVLLPSSNATSEPQFNAMRPAGVSWHLTRLRLNSTDPDEIRAMADDAVPASRMLADAGVGLIAFHCTAATTYSPGTDDTILKRIEDATGLPATATSKAVIAGLEVLGAKRVALLTPYPQHINDREVAFLEDHELTVTLERGKGFTSGAEMFSMTPDDWFEFAVQNRDADTDAYFLSCCAVRATDVIAALEQELGRPVITRNSATVWRTLRLSGIDDSVPGFGTLLSAH